MVRKTRKRSKTSKTNKTNPFKPLTVAALKVGRPIKVWERAAFVVPAPPPKSTRDFDVHYTFTPSAKPSKGRVPGTFKSANIAGWTGLNVDKDGLVSSNLDNTEAYIKI